MEENDVKAADPMIEGEGKHRFGVPIAQGNRSSIGAMPDIAATRTWKTQAGWP